MSYELEQIVIAVLVLLPLALAIAAFWVAGRGHWAALLLAAPAMLAGVALATALFNNPAGPGIIGVLVYSPLLLALGSGAIVRWHRRRKR